MNDFTAGLSTTSKRTLNLVSISLFFFCCSPGASAQAPLTGKIVNANSGEPVPQVNIYFANYGQKRFWGTVADENGNFKIDAPAMYRNDTLILSHIGYKLKNILPDSTGAGPPLVVEMEEDIRQLQPVSVSPLTAKRYLMECIKRKDDNYFGVAFSNTGFFWHWIKDNGQYKYLSQSYHTLSEDLTGGHLRLEVSHDSLHANLNYYNLSFLDSVRNSFVFDVMRTGGQFVNQDNLDDWQFTYDDNTRAPNGYAVMSGKRLDNFVNAQILVNENNFAIEQIDYHITWESEQYHNLNDTLMYRMESLDGKIVYKKNATKYFAQLIQNHARYSVHIKRNYKKLHSRETQSELVVFSSQEQASPFGALPYQVDDGTGLKQKHPNIVINKKSFCEAAAALHYESEVCH